MLLGVRASAERVPRSSQSWPVRANARAWQYPRGNSGDGCRMHALGISVN